MEKEIERIRTILLEKWNPCGFSGLPRDEYDAYIPEIHGLLKTNPDELGVARKLFEIEERYFLGRDDTPEALLPVARELLQTVKS